jgi:hypothetical protein
MERQESGEGGERIWRGRRADMEREESGYGEEESGYGEGGERTWRGRRADMDPNVLGSVYACAA